MTLCLLNLMTLIENDQLTLTHTTRSNIRSDFEEFAMELKMDNTIFNLSDRGSE